jgi:hypothetical protein
VALADHIGTLYLTAVVCLPMQVHVPHRACQPQGVSLASCHGHTITTADQPSSAVRHPQPGSQVLVLLPLTVRAGH